MYARLSKSVGRREMLVESGGGCLVVSIFGCASLGSVYESYTKASISSGGYDVKQSATFQDLGWRHCPKISGNEYEIMWSTPSRNLRLRVHLNVSGEELT
ncbi:hypothetical protein B296_00050664 [Ensete ventricosum]|uniref:Uncharacterized protein n=1 Tax=Ensete ventricosum TaxID=4639 RepID=A0A426Y5Q2_ENSVE|nr:hypothetical protein B296_00050664 [Ensete ventricosum]